MTDAAKPLADRITKLNRMLEDELREMENYRETQWVTKARENKREVVGRVVFTKDMHDQLDALHRNRK